MQAPIRTILCGAYGFPVPLLVPALALLLLVCPNLRAQSFPHGTVRLVAENSAVQAAHDFTLALHFSLEDGWHTYWVNPGDSGEPPRVNWTLPAGITAGPVEWPAPERLGSTSVVDYGYKNEVTLLVPMHASTDLSGPTSVTLNANVRVLVCKDICVPGKTQVTLALPVTTQVPAPDPAERGLFAGARASLPRAAPASWKFSAREEKDSFILSVRVGKRVETAYFYPLQESQIQNTAQQTVKQEATGFTLTLRKSDQLTKPVARLKGVLVLSDRAYKVDAAVVRAVRTGT